MAIYVYGLVCPIAGIVRYVGKTNKPEARLSSHIKDAAAGMYKHYAARWLRKLIAVGLRPEMKILATLDDSDDWVSVEKYYIANGKNFGWRLTNTTVGGDGIGFIRPEDKARWASNIKAAHGTPEMRKKMSEKLLAANKRPELKEKHRHRMRKRWEEPGYREDLLRKMQDANNRPGVKEKRSATGKEIMAAKEARKHVSDKLKAYYATEEGRNKKLATSRDPEKRVKAAEGQRRVWANQEYREAHIAKLKAAAASPEGQERLRLAWVKRKAAKAAAQQE